MRTPLWSQIKKHIDKAYKELDSLWNVSQFVPNPIPIITEKFHITRTEALHIVMCWQASRRPK